MEIEKKHIFKSYKNEHEVIDSIEKIKKEKESPINSSISGYNVEKPSSNQEYPTTNAFRHGDLDAGEPANKNFASAPTTDTPPVETNLNKEIERPLPEREMINRVR
jgi:hypothetical protein